jgi:hypothetical protein
MSKPRSAVRNGLLQKLLQEFSLVELLRRASRLLRSSKEQSLKALNMSIPGLVSLTFTRI